MGHKTVGGILIIAGLAVGLYGVYLLLDTAWTLFLGGLVLYSAGLHIARYNGRAVKQEDPVPLAEASRHKGMN